jgi:hypothetical protein
VILWTATAPASTLAVPDYALGETARVEIITPFRLVVIDPDGTEKLRQQEAARVPSIFRFNQNAGSEAETALKSALANHRRKFIDAIEAVFNERQISIDQLEQPRFHQVVRVYQRQNRNFLVLTNLARFWATGETDFEIQLEWSARLLAMQTNYIRAESLPESARKGPIRVLSVTPPDLPIDVTAALQYSTSAARSNLLALSRARQELQDAFPPEAQNIGKFLAGFVRENCQLDEQLTAEHRAARIQTIFAAHTYEAGESLVRSGAVMTPKINAALSEFRVRGRLAMRLSTNGRSLAS